MRKRGSLNALIVTFALANGLLYALLLPLWEGFDEPFHYGYVQELSTCNRLPILGKSKLSQEVWQSLLLVPVSHVVQANIPAVTSFETYFELTPSARHSLRGRLSQIPSAARNAGAEIANYEAHHPPLAYALLAIPNSMLATCSLLTRITVLRIVCVTFSVAFLAAAVVRLCSLLQLQGPLSSVVLFLVFSSQMFYAATAHVCNDWLAVPLAAWLIVTGICFHARPGLPTICWFALVLSLGLLTKAYFLAFLPLFLGLTIIGMLSRGLTWKPATFGGLILLLIAGPWYLRNLLIYGSLSGTPEDIAGIRIISVLNAAPHLPWMRSIGYMARASLWTGNNQFDTFSRLTLNAMLLLLFLGAVAYFWHLNKRRPTSADIVSLSAILLFVAAVMYSTVVSFVYTGAASAGASPWYMQVLLGPVLALVVCGMSRDRVLPRALTCLQVFLWSYVLVATYLIKLIPHYGGYRGGAHLSDIVGWYWNQGDSHFDSLSTVTLAPPLVLYALTLVVTFGWVALSVALCREVAFPRKRLTVSDA